MPTKDEIKQFSLLIEQIAEQLRCSRMDAILEHCKESGLEIEVASTLVSTALKAKIRDEAQELNLIKKTSKLPL